MAAAVGMIFVHFAESTHAESAKLAIAGRSFNKKKVEVVYYPGELYSKKVRVYCVAVYGIVYIVCIVCMKLYCTLKTV